MPADALPQTRPRVQDLGAAVLAGGDTEDVLALLVTRTLVDLGADTAALALPAEPGRWALELVEGAGAALLLGTEIREDTPLGRALRRCDADAVAACDPADLFAASSAPGQGAHVMVSPVDAGSATTGALIAVLGEAATLPEAAARQRLDAHAGLVAIALQGPDRDAVDVDDERGRIARDLHDLAIQELFAVGMELESLQRALRSPSAAGVDPQIARSAEASVEGVERAVAQIRQIVQSLRRDRPHATLTEQLRHESALAIAGLGFTPSLRLPADPAGLDREIPDEIAEDLVAVVRECLANAARHAHASAVAISVTLFSEGVDRVVQVDVSDNGRGIDPSVTRRSGLANMSSRARRHQGWVDAIPLEPGTMISWRVTVPPA